MTLRGRVVPVIDQRRRFEVAGQAGGRGRIIVVTVDGLQAGFAVDAASELRRIAAAEIAPVPALGDEAGGQVFDRVATLAGDGRMVLLIEPRALLDRAERDLLAGIAAAVPAA
ncbi:chemotaxis protein CheW [Paeniroseomonas aquatica]